MAKAKRQNIKASEFPPDMSVAQESPPKSHRAVDSDLSKQIRTAVEAMRNSAGVWFRVYTALPTQGAAQRRRILLTDSDDAIKAKSFRNEDNPNTFDVWAGFKVEADEETETA